MSNEIMQENIPFVECSAFHRGMSVLEASLRNTEDSEAIISGLLKGAAEFYGASRASVVEADWDLGIGVITYEWCKDGVPAQRDMLQCLPMEKFPRWRKALRANKPVVISDLQRLEKVYPDEAAFFREYGVTTLLAAPFSKRINQGFIAVDDPTRYTDDPVFLFIASYAVVVELNEIKQQQSLLAATKTSKYNPEDIHINFFGGMEIISSKGTLTGEDIKADQCYLLLAYLILNHKKNFTVDTLAEIICPYDELDSPYKVVNNIVYRLRRTLSVIGLDKLVIGKNGTFQINPNFNIHTDFDRFEDACIQLKTEENPDMRHSLYHSAVDMYKGQLYYKLKHQSIPILEQMLTNLQMVRNRRMLWSPDIVALNKRISDISSQNQTLAFLKQQGLVDPDIFIAKTNELTKQLRQAKLEKEKLMDAESDMTALQTRDLIDILEGGPEFLDSFDTELFAELVEKIIIENNDSVRFCLKNGLELRESIERTVR